MVQMVGRVCLSRWSSSYPKSRLLMSLLLRFTVFLHLDFRIKFNFPMPRKQDLSTLAGYIITV